VCVDYAIRVPSLHELWSTRKTRDDAHLDTPLLMAGERAIERKKQRRATIGTGIVIDLTSSDDEGPGSVSQAGPSRGYKNIPGGKRRKLSVDLDGKGLSKDFVKTCPGCDKIFSHDGLIDHVVACSLKASKKEDEV